jgi:signal transduction histidine kinase
VATSYLLLRGNHFSMAAMADHVPRLLVFLVVSILAGALHEATRRARLAAESASQAKTQFLAMVSHELRTPLSPVVTAAEMLESDPNLPASLRSDLQIIRRNVQTEIRLIDDLVDLTRINVGKMSLRFEPVDVHEPLKSAMRVCEADAWEKQQQISVRLEAESSVVMGDAVRLQQVFWNLLRNAIKFTPDRGRISVSTSNLPGHFVQITVADTGIGIDSQKLSLIFEAFEQGGPEIQERFGGLGLGLAICRALVAAHHGSIQVQSAGPGKGTAFTVQLPTNSQS